MRVLIVGEGKSGTTALMRSVATCLVEPVELFEPPKLTAADLEPETLVVKKLLLQWTLPENELLPSFDKRVLIVRDPRDRLISHLLYDAYNQAPNLDQVQRNEWIALLQRKIENPASVSMTSLIEAWWQLGGLDMYTSYVRVMDRLIRFQRQIAGDTFHHLSYEDYVAGSFDELNSYLGLQIKPGVVTGAEDRVVRSKSSGAWMEWFTPSDIDVFRPMTSRWIETAKPELAHWDLRNPEAIDPVTSVDYVRNLFKGIPYPA